MQSDYTHEDFDWSEFFSSIKHAMVFAHKTGKKLNTVELKALPKDLSKEDRKTAIENDYVHHGYFSKEEGKGKKTDKTPIACGNSIYYSKDSENGLNGLELTTVKQFNFKRIGNRRTTETILDIRSLINVANDKMYSWTAEQAANILEKIHAELAILENKLLVITEPKEVNEKYKFSM